MFHMYVLVTAMTCLSHAVANVLSLVISYDSRVASFTSTLWQSDSLHEFNLPQKRKLSVFYKQHNLAYLNHNSMTWADMSPSTTIFEKSGAKTI